MTALDVEIVAKLEEYGGLWLGAIAVIVGFLAVSN